MTTNVIIIHLKTCWQIDQQNESQVFEEADARSTGKWRGEAGLLATPPNGSFPQQNVGPVKFEVPKVPVIFVLGVYRTIKLQKVIKNI